MSLPENIHLLTLEPWKANSILIRFEHILAKDEDEQLSKPITFDLMDVFRGFDIEEVRETTLAGNQWTNEANRFEFTEEITNSNEDSPTKMLFNNKPEYSKNEQNSSSNIHNHSITLNPMEIRTFVIVFKSK